MGLTKKTWIAAAIALAACSTNGDDLSSEAPNANSTAGGQSGTEGQRASACSCRLGEPLHEVALDAERSADYFASFSPNELFDIVEGTRTFYCPKLDETLVVEIVRGDAARVLSGVMPSDTGGKDGTCRGVELDVTLTIHGSNGLSASATALRMGSQCELNYGGGSAVSALPWRVFSEVPAQATRNCQPLDAVFSLYDATGLSVKIGKDRWDSCKLLGGEDAAVQGDASTDSADASLPDGEQTADATH